MKIKDLVGVYIATPKNTNVDLLRISIIGKIFIFADSETMSFFLNFNQNAKMRNHIQTKLIGAEIGRNSIVLLNDKDAYRYFVLPKLEALGIKKIYFYKDSELYEENFGLERRLNADKQAKIKEKLLVQNYKKLRNRHLERSTKQDVCPVCECRVLNKVFQDIVRLDSLKTYAISGDYYISCTQCGLIMKDIVYPNEYYSEYINAFYTLVPTRTEEYTILKAKTRIDILKSLNIKFQNVLEVSSFDGATLVRLQQDFNVNAIGIEPTKITAESSIQEFSSLKNKIVIDVFENFLNHKESAIEYDAVVFSHCFRHFNNPILALEILDKITKQGSIVLLDEGNFVETVAVFADSKNKIQREPFQQKAFLYSVYNLSYLFAKHGFKLLQIYSQSYVDSVIKYNGLLFKKASDQNSDSELLELSLNNSIAFLEIYKKYSFSTDNTIQALKKLG